MNSVESDDLKWATQLCWPVASRAADTMRHFRLRTFSECLLIEATDHEVWSTAKVPGKFGQKQTLVVPARAFHDAARESDKGSFTILSQVKNRLMLASGNTSHLIPLCDDNYWPEGVGQQFTTEVHCDAGELVEAATRCAGLTGHNEAIKIGSPLFVSFATTDRQTLKVMSCTRYRFSVDEVKAQYPTEINNKLLGSLPISSCHSIAAIPAASLNDDVTLSFSASTFEARAGLCKVAGRLMVVQPPPIKQIAKRDVIVGQCSIAVDDLASLARRGSVVVGSGDDCQGKISLTFADGKVVCESLDSEAGKSVSEMECICQGKIEAIVQRKFITDFAKVVQPGTIVQVGLYEPRRVIQLDAGPFRHGVALMN